MDANLLFEENKKLKLRLKRTEGKAEDIYRFLSKTSQTILNDIREISPVEPSVLLIGESGTGVESICRVVHQSSHRAEGPWITLNCAELNDAAFEPELMGFEKGAILGVSESKAGLLELAQGGTLCLFNFDNLSLHRQTQLFGIVKAGAFRKLGGREDLKLDVKLLASARPSFRERAENDDIVSEIFDLILDVPSLRDRKSEILAQALRYGEASFRAQGKRFQGFSSDVESFMQIYSWPGNDAEMVAAIQRAALVTDGTDPISLFDLGFSSEPKSFSLPQPQGHPLIRTFNPSKGVELSFTKVKKQWSSSFERDYLVFILKRHQGNVSAAARDARLDRSNFLRLLRKHTIKSEEYRTLTSIEEDLKAA